MSLSVYTIVRFNYLHFPKLDDQKITRALWFTDNSTLSENV